MHASDDDLEERLQELAGDALRAIVRYGEDGIDVAYMSEAAESGGDPEEKLAAVRALTDVPADGPFGEYEVGVHAFGGVLVVHVVTGEDAGAVATIDRDAGTDVSPADVLG